MGALCLPRYLEVFPELAFAALKARDEAVFSAWVAIRAWDSDRDGSGYVARDDFLDSVKQALGVGERQRLRIASAGDGRFWDLTNNGHVRLHSAEAVARMEGVERVSRPHLIRQTEFRGAARRRATLMATAYRTDKLGVPLTRRDIQALTGVAPASQRRLDRDHRQAVRVTPVFACLGPQVSQFYADTIGEEGKGLGFFSGRGKMLFRRHGDIRTAPEHRVGSSTAARRLNRALKGARRPATSSRGQRPNRSYFQGEKAVQSWMRDRRARGKVGSGAPCTHPLLDYSLVLGSPGPKRHRGNVLSEQMGASRLSGGSIHRGGAMRLP